MRPRPFNVVLEFLRWTLIALSVVAVVLSISKAIQSPFFHDHLYDDFIGVLGFFQPFGILFAATFLVVGAGFLLKHMSFINESNRSVVESAERNRWISFITSQLDLMTDYPDMKTDIQKKLPAIHDHLFKKKFAIHDKTELDELFSSFFRSKVRKYEENNLPRSTVKYYPDSNHSFSFSTFKSIFILMVDDEKSYGKMDDDLRYLYMEEVRRFSKDFINPESHAKAMYEK